MYDVQITGTQHQLQFDSSTKHGQGLVLTILYGSTRLAVWLGLKDAYGFSNVWVCLGDNSSGVCM